MAEVVPVCVDAPRKIRLSWSRLKAYEACRQRVHLQMRGVRTATLDGRVFLPGTLADRAMRLWLEQGTFEHRGMHTFLEQLWAEHTGPDAEYQIKWRGSPTDDKRSVLANVTRALDVLEPILLEKVAPYAFKPEYRFTATLGMKDPWDQTQHIEMFGAVDVAVHMGDGRYALYDLKITENDTYIRSTLAQLTFYDLAFRGWTGTHPVEHAFWTPLLPQPVVPLDVTEVERRQMYGRIMSYCHGVWTNQWQLTGNTSECFNCPTKVACPRYVTPIDKDAQGRNRTTFSRAEFDVMETTDA